MSMDHLLQIILSNTLFAAILALAALAISRTFRRPALAHALWLLVLLKLITPPLFNIPLPIIPADQPAPNKTTPLLPAIEPTPPDPTTVAFSGLPEIASAPQQDRTSDALVISPAIVHPPISSPQPAGFSLRLPHYLLLTWL